MSETTLRAFFGDAEHEFCLTPWAIGELEKATSTGIGTLIERIRDGHFRHAEIVETIRLALIGGGMSPQNAKTLTDSYATPRPLGEVFPLVLAIHQKLWLGERQPAPDDAHG